MAPDHAAVIERLYAALRARDGDAMAACYAPDATFRDPAFGALVPGEVQRMWRMLTSRAGDMHVELPEHSADLATGRAHWIATYVFAKTGRTVRNDVRSAFRFHDGLIADQVDTFDLRAWAAQALGPPGRVLGFTPLLGPAIRRQTRSQLDAYAGESTTGR